MNVVEDKLTVKWTTIGLILLSVVVRWPHENVHEVTGKNIGI